MSLMKFWNSLCGRASAPIDTVSSGATDKPRDSVTPGGALGGSTEPTSSKPTDQATTAASSNAAQATGAQVSTPRRGVLSMLSRGEHDGLLKIIQERKPSRILEIGVGDGSRTPALLSMLSQSGCQPGDVKVIVIDEFELAGGDVTMRDYHRQLAGLSIRPVIFPEPVGRGIFSVAHRFGAVDMVLVDAKVSATYPDELANLLVKVTHERSVVLSNESGKWTPRQRSENRERRAA